MTLPFHLVPASVRTYALVFFIFLPSFGLKLTAQPLAEEYAWRFPVPNSISQAHDLIDILREETNKILQFHPLAPIRSGFSDLYWEDYFLYQEPGRLITTLAWMYPYMTKQQQVVVDLAVKNELNDPELAPWSEHYTVPRYAGASRTLYKRITTWGIQSSFGDYRPRLHTLYGFWLYAYRAGKTEWLTSYYEVAKQFYLAHHQRAKLYGDMCGHVAMARLAEINNDIPMMETALLRLEEELQDGLDISHKHNFARDGFQGWDAPYNRSPGSAMYDTRKDGWVYRGFIFLNMGSEMARFLRDSCFQQVDSMHRYGTNLMPLWWLMQAPYFTRWTGDEAIGLPSEAFGMYHPVATWVLGKSPQQLRRYMRSSPTGIGDCYWLEALVQTIEAHAQTTTWQDVRISPFPEINFDSTTSTHHPSASVITWNVFPNPIKDQIQLSWNPPGTGILWTAWNINGVKIAKGSNATDNGTLGINCSDWPSGAYTIEIRTPDGRHLGSKRVIK